MNRNTLIVLSAVAITSAACASQKPAAVEPIAPIVRQTPRKVEAPPTEVAQGEVREAMLRLQRVHFALNAATLSPQAQQSVKEAAALLDSHPQIHLFVDGHTDQRGSQAYNMVLGERRAKAVVEFMAENGVERGRLHVASHGKKTLLDAQRNTAAMARNRRVEFRLMKGEVQLVLNEGTLLDDRGRVLSQR